MSEWLGVALVIAIVGGTSLVRKLIWNPKYRSAAEAAGLSGLKGHRSVGGFRASIYNAMDIDAIDALVAVMKTFANR